MYRSAALRTLHALLHYRGPGVGVVLLHVPPNLLCQFALGLRVEFAAIIVGPQLVAETSIRSISGSPSLKTCRLMPMAGPFPRRCSHQSGSRICNT